jgi:membrane fusion protein (multidrug efflux system)
VQKEIEMFRLNVLVMLWLTSLLGACGEEAVKVADAPLPTVGVVTATEREVTPSIEFVGRIEAVSRVDLRARVTGFLEKQKFQDGQSVSAGDLLFVIEQEPFAAAVKQAESDLAAAKAQAENAGISLERAKELITRNTIPQATVDDRQAAKRVADATVLQREAALEQARIIYSYTEIRAPIDGRIGRTAVKPGNLVTPEAGILATIVKKDPVYVAINVTEGASLEVRRAMAAAKDPKEKNRIRIKLRLSDGSIYAETGAFDFADVQVNPTTDTILFRGLIANPKGILVDRQIVVAILETAEPEERLVIPEPAISFDQRGRFVLVVNNENKVEERFISIGDKVLGGVSVTKGLEAGERLIVEGILKVRPGMKVNTVVTQETRM